VNWGVDLQAEFRNVDGIADPTVSLVFTSSDSLILEIVDGRGVGRSPGNAVIFASIAGSEDNGLVAELAVEVLESRESINITVSTDELGVGQSFIFDANYIDPSGLNTTTPIVWESADESIATVSPSGEVVGVGEGQVDIIVTAGFASDRTSVIVVQSQVVFEEEVNITLFTTDFTIGETFTFEASFFDESGGEVTDKTFVWASSDESVATVNENGEVTGIGEGRANIIASVGDVSTFVEITVEEETQIQTRRTGTLRGIRGYRYSGDFSLSFNDAGDLILRLENVTLDNRAPGPYWYLTNSQSSINGGISLGRSQSGTNEINVTQMFPDMEIGLNTFESFIIWCEPFNIQLGIGDYDEIDFEG